MTTVLTADIIANEALMRLENKLDVLQTFHRAYEDEFDKKVNGYNVGDTISIRRPHDPRPRRGRVMNTQEVIEGKVALTVDQVVGHDFQFTTEELNLKIDQLSERVIEPAIDNIVNDMLRDCLEQFYMGVPDWVGTPGALIDSYQDFSRGPQRLDDNSVPVGNRHAALTTGDHYALLGNQTAMYVSDAAKQAYRESDLGRIAKTDIRMTQVMPTHTVGDHAGSPLTRGTDNSVTYDAVKNTWSMTLSTDGWTGSKVLKAGDVFTIGSDASNTVYKVNALTKKSTGIPQQFVILEDKETAASGSNETALKICPPIITSGPHQTVDKAPGDDVAIAMVGTANTPYKQNLVYHKNAFALAIVPIARPAGVVDWSRKSQNGVSVSIEAVRDGVNWQSAWRLDVMYARRLVHPQLAARMSG